MDDAAPAETARRGNRISKILASVCGIIFKI